MSSRKPSITRSYIREIVFGFEDSLVSTVGALTGIAVGAGDKGVVILAGLVLIVVEATSMAGGSIRSNKAVGDSARTENATPSFDERHPIFGGLVMGVSYILAGLVPLVPYLFLPLTTAPVWSIGFTLAVLFGIGTWLTRFTHRPVLRSGFEVLVIGGVAICLGYLVGRFVSGVFGMGL